MIGIIYCNDLNMCPYIDKYIDSLEKEKLEYKVLLWSRDGDSTNYSDKCIVYFHKSELYIPKWKKIPAYLGYAFFLYREIQRNKFDKLIMLTSLPAVICFLKLIWNYRCKYIYDFRDLSFEKNILYRKVVERLIKQSFFTCISSPGFRNILNGNTVIAHNFRNADLKNRVISMKPIGKKIVLLHIGISRGEHYNKRLADIFGNDERFEVNIIGTGNDTYSFLEYTKRFKNIYVKGTYNNQEKRQYIMQCDALLYYYPCSFNNDRALANKYYDGIIYKKPLIGNKETYSGKRLESRGLGISVNIDEDRVQDKIYQYLQELDAYKYENCVEIELKKIIAEDFSYREKIDEFIHS